MLRSIAVLCAALHLANPTLSAPTRALWARLLQKDAGRHQYDPLTAVAVGWHESHWIPTVVSDNGCYGLFQVCVRSAYAFCRGEGFAGARCQAERNALLDPAHAIAVFGASVERWEKLCRARTGRPALLHRWLAGYQGVDAVRGTVCGQRRVHGRWRDTPMAPITRSVMDWRRRAIRRLASRSP